MHKINTKLRIPLILSPRVFNSSWIIISTHQKRINKHICLHIFFTFITWKEKEEVTCSFSYLPSHNSHGFGITYLTLSLFMYSCLMMSTLIIMLMLPVNNLIVAWDYVICWEFIKGPHLNVSKACNLEIKIVSSNWDPI